MAIKYDELKKALLELKKNTNCSYSQVPNATTGTSGGENSIYKNVVAPMNMAEKAEAGSNPKVMSVKKPLAPKDVEDAGPASFKITVPKGNKGVTSERHPMSEDGIKKMNSPAGQDMMAMSEDVIKFDKNGQWRMEKSAFKTLQHKIEGQGHSADSAAAITASIGRKELGQKEMTARSKAGMNKVDPEETVNIPHPKTKAKIMPMAHKPNSNGQWSLGKKEDPSIHDDGVNRNANPKLRLRDLAPDADRDTDVKLGTNQRVANPPHKECPDPRGKVHMVKDEGTNKEAASSKPHNKGKFKVEDEVKEKESKKEKVSGLPYNGDDKKVHKGEKIESADAKGYEEQRAQNKARHGGFGL